MMLMKILIASMGEETEWYDGETMTDPAALVILLPS
jgi:hypothetical protein